MFSNKTTLLIIISSLFLLTAITFSQEKKEYEETLKLDSYGMVTIDTYKGSVKVEVWDKDEVHFYAEVEPDTDGWNTSPKEQLERCRIQFTHSHDLLSLKSDYKKNILGMNTLANVHYKIKMPATAKLKIDDYKSEIDVNGLKSNVEIESYKGVIEVKNFSGDLMIDTYKGSAFVNVEELKDDLEFDTYKGEISVELPESSNFDFEFDLSRHGEFHSDFDMMMKDYGSDDEVIGSVNGGGPRIKFSTYKGEIDLKKID